MRTLAALAVMTLASLAGAQPIKDPTKLSWVNGAVDTLKADAPAPGAKVPAPQAGATPAGQPAAAAHPHAGRLAYVLRERKITIKKVLRGRRTKPRPDAPQRKSPAR